MGIGRRSGNSKGFFTIVGVCRMIAVATMIMFLVSTMLVYFQVSISESEIGSLVHAGIEMKLKSLYDDSPGNMNAPMAPEPASGTFGDSSEHYRRIRGYYDQRFPPDEIGKRAPSLMRELRKRNYTSVAEASPEAIGYDIYDCPTDPPPGYPAEFPTLDLLQNWHPEVYPKDDGSDAEIKIYQGLCVFDFTKDFEKAWTYREAELPFVIRNDPDVLRTVERWNRPEYLAKILGRESHRAEHSLNNHFMYWTNGSFKRNSKRPPGWKPPTKNIRMTYGDWLQKANVTETSLTSPQSEHWYFRLIGCGFLGRSCDFPSSDFLYDEIPIFRPPVEPEETLYLVKPETQKGIHCRFGMRGVIAENHFDGSRNVIAVFGGERRYILSSPKECKHLCLYPREHPSGRHSAVDWTEPDLEKFPEFKKARSNEVVLQAGDVLYLPTFWFHFIVSLELNYQCNTRSGITRENSKHIHKCGF